MKTLLITLALCLIISAANTDKLPEEDSREVNSEA